MIRALLVFVVLMAAPAAADACSVCFSATDDNRWAFILTTALLTLLPLGLIGSVVTWLVLRVRRARREEFGYAPRPASSGRVRP